MEPVDASGSDGDFTEEIINVPVRSVNDQIENKNVLTESDPIENDNHPQDSRFTEEDSYEDDNTFAGAEDIHFVESEWDDDDLEYEDSLSELGNSSRRGSKISKHTKPSHKQNKSTISQGDNNNAKNKILVALIAALAVVLAVTVLSIISFARKGSFNPIALFKSEASADTDENPDDNDTAEEKDAELAEPAEQVVTVEPKVEEVTEEPAETDLFSEFLAGNVSATVAYDFLSTSAVDELEPGREYNISEIREMEVNYYESNNFFDSVVPSIYYARLSIQNESVYALKFLYTSYGATNAVDVENHTFIIRENNGGLEIKFAVWQHFIEDYGNKIKDLVNNEGIATSGIYGDDGRVWEAVWAPDEDFTYKRIYKLEGQPNTNAGYFDSDDYEGINSEPLEPLHTIAREAYSENGDAKHVIYYKEQINGESFYYYLGDKDHPITQDTVNYIDAIASSYGFGFDGKAAADEARTVYEKELGVYEACQNQTEPQWTELD